MNIKKYLSCRFINCTNRFKECHHCSTNKSVSKGKGETYTADGIYCGYKEVLWSD